MASIRKIKDKWLAEVRIRGVYKSKTFFSKIEAQSWSVGIERELGKHQNIASSYTLGDAMERYKNEISPTKKGARWEQVRLDKLKRLGLADIRLSHLTREDIENWINDSSLRLKSGSILREIVLLSSVLKTARVRWKWFEGDPLKDAHRPKSPPPRDKRIHPEVEILIIQELTAGKQTALKHELSIGFQLALETAMRQGEIWGLDWQHVFLDKRYVYLADTKNGFSRQVPLSKQAVALIKQLSPQEKGRVFKSNQQSASTIFRKVLKKAGVAGITFHDTRHEALTRLARKIDVLDLARMVGHRDTRSLMVYYNATASEIAARLD